MDDSPLKAVLQPWNHLCVSEYGSARRKLDIQIAERELQRKWLAEREQGRELERIWEAEQALERTWIAEREGAKEMMADEEEGTVEEERKRRRKEKKSMKRDELKEQQLLELHGKEEIGGVEEESYDELLLAVIGILDALKHEGNVAGWMRSGGLVHVAGDHQETISETPETETSVSTAASMTIPVPIPNPETILTTPPTPRSKRDSSTTSIQGPSKRRRLAHDTEGLDPASKRILELDSDSEMVVVQPTTPTMATSSMSVPSSPLLNPSPPHSSSSSSSSPLFSAQAEQASTGVPLSTTAETAAPLSTTAEAAATVSSSSSSTIPTASGNINSVSTPTQTTTPPFPQLESQNQTKQDGPPPLLWYEIPCVLSHWVQRGRKALAELGIEVIHGVVPPNLN